MRQDYHDLLKAEIINSIDGLSLIARVIVEGYLSGLNPSRSVGAGMEFSQYRGYEPGDDLRLLDWKMLARSGRYFIKQSEVEAHISIKFIIDASRSMLHEEEGLKKMDYARVLIASIAYLAQKQGDAIGLIALNDHNFYSLYPQIRKQHFNRLLLELINIKNEGKWPVKKDSTQRLRNDNHRELIFFVTDMYEHNEELLREITQLKISCNEVIVFHLMGRNELEFNFTGTMTFEDMETGKRVKVNTDEARSQYLHVVQSKIDQIKNVLTAENIGYEVFRMDEPIEHALNLFLKKRHLLS